MTRLRYCSPAATCSPLLEDLSEAGRLGYIALPAIRGVKIPVAVSVSPITELHRFSFVLITKAFCFFLLLYGVYGAGFLPMFNSEVLSSLNRGVSTLSIDGLNSLCLTTGIWPSFVLSTLAYFFCCSSLTNVRASGSDQAIILTPPRKMTLEQMMAYMADDELLEVTPMSLRLRKKILLSHLRKRAS